MRLFTEVERRQSSGFDEHFWAEIRRTCFETIEEMYAALAVHLASYNERRAHQGGGL